MIKKLFTFGCSFTKDYYQDTWANYVSKEFGLELDNRAERGAGANFISKRILASTDITPNDSIVMIMWPCADRFDLWADQTVPHLIHDQVYASWSDGQKPRLIDHNGVKRHDQGFILNGSVPRGYKHKYYKFFYSPHQAVHDWYTCIIQTQLFLRFKNIPTVMMTAFPLNNPLQYHVGPFDIDPGIYNNIDLDQFVGPYHNSGFYPWCIENNLEFLDTHHPGSVAHYKWLELYVFRHIKSKLGISSVQ